MCACVRVCVHVFAVRSMLAMKSMACMPRDFMTFPFLAWFLCVQYGMYEDVNHRQSIQSKYECTLYGNRHCLEH